MNCCIECFNDSYIKDKIKSEGVILECDYCEGEETYIISIEALIDDFENLLVIYEQTMHGEHYSHELHCPTDFGESLEELIQEDWNVFSDDTNQNSLLFDILNFDRGPEDYLDSHELYSRHDSAFTFVSSSNIWDEFSYSIRRQNRYFPKNDLSSELQILIPNKSMNFDINTKFYRARIGEYPKEEMGPPPFSIATPGRVNPKGIPYLYAASDEITCIAETRPWVGAKITVATIQSTKFISIIDLSSKEFLDSPFLADNLSQTLQANELINQLSYELSRPVNPDDSYLEYIPTQYLAELIKNLGYDGLRYKSSLGTGENLVLFYPDNFDYITTDMREISFVEYDYQ